MNNLILPVAYSCRTFKKFLAFTVFTIFLLTKANASTWIDPFFDEGISKAKLIAIGKLKSVNDDQKTFEISQILKGSVKKGDNIIIWDGEEPGHSHGNEEGVIDKEYLIIVTTYNDTFSTFTPTFGLFQFTNDSIYIPIKDPHIYVHMKRELLVSYISLQLKDDAMLRNKLTEQSNQFLTRSDVFTKDADELGNQVMHLEIIAHFGNQKHTSVAVTFLKSPYNHIRWAAVDALTHIGNAQAITALIGHLENETSRDVLSILGKSLYRHKPSTAKEPLRRIIPQTSGKEVELGTSIMDPVFNTLPAERHSLAAALMRIEGLDEPYDTLVVRAQKWLRIESGLTIDDIEELKTWYAFEDALKTPDSVYRMFINDSMKRLPSEIARLKNLRELSLAIPDLEELPPSLAELKNLEVLSITKGTFKEIPKAVFEIRSLKKLFFQIDIDSISPTISNLKKLRVLRLGKVANHILPETICQLTDLTDLGLRMSGIDSLPLCIATLPNLRSIEIYGNDFASFPMALLNSPSIQIIEIGSNDVKQLPADLSRMKKLKYIDLSYNPLSINERKRIESSYRGININTEVNKDCYYSVEEAISNAETAEAVNDCNNNISIDKLPYERLTKTKYLILTNNNMRQIPDGILVLSQLKSLNLTDNHITDIPAAIGNMKELRTLNLSGNPIKSIPEEMQNLTSLTDLFLYGCNLTDVPEWIKELPSLQILSLSKNPISNEQKEKIRGWFKDKNITLYLD